MVLMQGAKLVVSHRRLFAEDQPRYFFGVVDTYADGIAKVSGFTWVRDPTHGYQRKSDRRTKLISVASGNLIIYEIPKEIELEDIVFEQNGVSGVTATDGVKFRMDLSERA